MTLVFVVFLLRKRNRKEKPADDNRTESIPANNKSQHQDLLLPPSHAANPFEELEITPEKDMELSADAGVIYFKYVSYILLLLKSYIIINDTGLSDGGQCDDLGNVTNDRNDTIDTSYPDSEKPFELENTVTSADKLVDTNNTLQIEAAPKPKLNLKLENYYDSDEWNIFGGELFVQSSSSSNGKREHENKANNIIQDVTAVAASEATNHDDGDLILSEFIH